MSYKRSNKDEQRILNQYEIAVTTVGKASATEKSNVLFLERYYDLMAPDAELLTVIDNTVLNGVDSQRYRDFILERFVLRQVTTGLTNASTSLMTPLERHNQIAQVA